MPIIKSAIKRARQNEVRRKRLQPYRSHMKTMVRKFTDFLTEKKVKEATALLPAVQKSIDTASKKNIIPRNTADRKKSKVARMLAKASA